MIAPYYLYVPIIDPFNRALFSQERSISMGARSVPYDRLVGVDVIPRSRDVRPGGRSNAFRYGGQMANTCVGWYHTTC